MTLAEAITHARKRAFLTQEQFAVEIHSSAASINRWENGRGKPNLSTMKNIKNFCVKNRIPYDEIETEWLNFSK